MKQVLPYSDSGDSKKEQVEQMFDQISRRYDLLNRVLSMGTDIQWRNKVVRLISRLQPETILDMATGTADLAIAMTKTGAKKITGGDISEGMLQVGREKVKKRGFENIITLQKADAENLPFTTNSFDVATVAFGVRNFENLEKGLAELHRVLKSGGSLVVLEFSQPTAFPFKQFYSFYLNNILPLIGRMISKDPSAYTYLPESVKVFPYGKQFAAIMERVGFTSCEIKPLSFGIATIYIGKK